MKNILFNILACTTLSNVLMAQDDVYPAKKQEAPVVIETELYMLEMDKCFPTLQ